jgi:organic hydroperoxide reductase OsmC/OhrA
LPSLRQACPRLPPPPLPSSAGREVYGLRRRCYARFVLSFRAIARASKFEWSDLACRVEGVLERVDGVTQFTRYTTVATVTVAAESTIETARRLLEKAEHVCLISNSLRGERVLVAEVVVAG